MANLVDTMHLGHDRVIGAWEVRPGVIVDPGPGSTVETLLEGLEAEPRALLLTHIHLDHAGASGVLARRFPDLQVFVHEVGAPHVIDPSRLLKSAERLYGDEMDKLWGEVAPVPEERVTILNGGEEVEGLDVHYAPGHARHHVVYHDPESGDAYTGDVAGCRVPPIRARRRAHAAARDRGRGLARVDPDAALARAEAPLHDALRRERGRRRPARPGGGLAQGRRGGELA